MLGKWFERGNDLSGGEWQKVALARAFMREAEVLVLDEPTAALDAMNEYAIFQRFRELTDNKIALLISHRFSTVRMADRIVVLDGRAHHRDGDARGVVGIGRGICQAVHHSGRRLSINHRAGNSPWTNRAHKTSPKVR